MPTVPHLMPSECCRILETIINIIQSQKQGGGHIHIPAGQGSAARASQHRPEPPSIPECCNGLRMYPDHCAEPSRRQQHNNGCHCWQRDLSSSHMTGLDQSRVEDAAACQSLPNGPRLEWLHASCWQDHATRGHATEREA